MAAGAKKRATHEVIQSGVYFTSGEDGRPAELELGTHLVLSKKQAVKMEKRGMVKSLSNSKLIDVTKDDGGKIEAVVQATDGN